MDGCHEALGNGDYASAIRLLLDWNKAVMETAGPPPGCGWVTDTGSMSAIGETNRGYRTGTIFLSCGATATSSTP